MNMGCRSTANKRASPSTNLPKTARHTDGGQAQGLPASGGLKSVIEPEIGCQRSNPLAFELERAPNTTSVLDCLRLW